MDARENASWRRFDGFALRSLWAFAYGALWGGALAVAQMSTNSPGMPSLNELPDDWARFPDISHSGPVAWLVIWMTANALGFWISWLSLLQRKGASRFLRAAIAPTAILCATLTCILSYGLILVDLEGGNGFFFFAISAGVLAPGALLVNSAAVGFWLLVARTRTRGAALAGLYGAVGAWLIVAPVALSAAAANPFADLTGWGLAAFAAFLGVILLVTVGPATAFAWAILIRKRSPAAIGKRRVAAIGALSTLLATPVLVVAGAVPVGRVDLDLAWSAVAFSIFFAIVPAALIGIALAFLGVYVVRPTFLRHASRNAPPGVAS